MSFLKLLTTSCYQAKLDVDAYRNSGLYIWNVWHYIIVPVDNRKRTITDQIGNCRNGIFTNTVGAFSFTHKRLSGLIELLELINEAEAELRLHPEFIDL